MVRVFGVHVVVVQVKVEQGSFVLQMFHELWDGFVDESCRANMPKAEACLYGELGMKHLF